MAQRRRIPASKALVGNMLPICSWDVDTIPKSSKYMDSSSLKKKSMEIMKENQAHHYAGVGHGVQEGRPPELHDLKIFDHNLVSNGEPVSHGGLLPPQLNLEGARPH